MREPAVPRIEVAEVLSFRLKVPREDLEGLPAAFADLPLRVAAEDGELLLLAEDADSFLRFRPIGKDAVLTEVTLAKDERGVFFQRVLGPLMVRYQGDLHLRLVWNHPDRNSHGDFAEVKIARGSTTYPGLSNQLAARPEGLGEPAGGLEGAEELPPPLPSAEEKEVNELVQRARAQWEEYQRLKGKKG